MRIKNDNDQDIWFDIFADVKDLIHQDKLS
jgi:hypothetical protein